MARRPRIFACLTRILLVILAAKYLLVDMINSLDDVVFTLQHEHTICSSDKPKFAAVMFHSEPDQFESVLADLLPHIHEMWVVRLFLPWRRTDGGRDSQFFYRSEQRILGMNVVQQLAAKCVHVEVMKHDVSDFPIDHNLNARWTIDSGPVIANHFALSRETYESINEQQMLFFQQDSAFCSGANRTLDSFMHHKYLGAPWLPGRIQLAGNGKTLTLLYGNGGLSIRSKRFALFCINLAQYQHDWIEARLGNGLAEDIYFSRCLFEHFEDKVDIHEARFFAAEEFLDHPNFPFFAVHDPCRVAESEFAVGCSTEGNIRVTQDLIQKCPESRRVTARCVASCGFGKVDTSWEDGHSVGHVGKMQVLGI
jgi:hypothetical protein